MNDDRRPALDELVGLDAVSARDDDESGELTVVTVEAFAAVDEPGGESILGSSDGPLIAYGSDTMVYGDGGVGKTTLVDDLGFHLAAGDDWLGIPVPKPVRVLIIENEGPRPLFRRKLARKLAQWEGSSVDARLYVYEGPWGEFTFAEVEYQLALSETIREHEIDVLLVGPLTSVGMESAGLISEVRTFLKRVDAVREASGRPVAVVLVHHENKGGKVSGAWEGAGDTLLHVQQRGHGNLRVHVQKARWSSEHHARTLNLAWADGEGFQLADEEPKRPERVWDDIENFVLEHGGCSWNEVDAAVSGQATYKRKRRDQMLSDGLLLNTGTGTKFALWHRDDPVHPTIEASASEQGRTWDAPSSATGDGAAETGASVRPPLKGTHLGRTHLSDTSPGTDDADDTSAGRSTT